MNVLERFKNFIADTERYTEAQLIDYSIDDSNYLTVIYKENTATIKERYSYLKENDSFQLFFKQSY